MDKTGIIFFVYHRPAHTERVLAGLKQNQINKLYVFSDGPKDQADFPAVKEVRQLIDAIDWCQTEVIKSKGNKGLVNSIVEGINYVLARHERIIVVEDDCVPTPGFIAFIEKCLEIYQDHRQIMSVSGYSWPVSIPIDYQYDLYFWYRFCPWGWGTWQRAWQYFSIDQTILSQINKSGLLREKLNLAGEDNLISMLKAQLAEGVNTWDVFWAINILINDGLCINPVKSYIQNIGYDGSGVHCGITNAYDVELSPQQNIDRLVFPPVIYCDRRIEASCQTFFSMDSNCDQQKAQALPTLDTPPGWKFIYVDHQSWQVAKIIESGCRKALSSQSPYPGTRLAVCSAVPNNNEQLVKVQAGSIEGEQVGLAARTGGFYGSRSGYYLALLDGNKLVLRSWLTGQTVHWLETAFHWQARQWYWLKLRCQADHLLLGKAWPDGDPEPDGWMLQGHCHKYIGGYDQGIIANAPGMIIADNYRWQAL